MDLSFEVHVLNYIVSLFSEAVVFLLLVAVARSYSQMSALFCYVRRINDQIKEQLVELNCEDACVY